MKNIISVLIATIIAVAAVSCRKAPINGHLDGMWQIMSVEYPSQPTLRPDRYYLCFYRHTANLRHYGGFNIGGNLFYDEEAGNLSVEFPYSGTWLGIIGIPEHTPYTADFKILKLTRTELVMLLDDSVTYSLRKF